MNIFSLNRNTENSVIITSQLLRLLEVNVTQESLQNSLTGHSDYPSIISIADTLLKFKVINTITKVVPGNMDELDTPFIARLTTENGSFVVVKEITNDYIEYLSPDYKARTIRIHKSEFLKMWTGLVLLAESDERSGEQGYLTKRKAEILDNLRLPLIFFGFLLLTILFTALVSQYNRVSFYAVLLTWTKLIGCVVTGILLTHEIDKNNPVLRFICKPGKKINCNAILDSGASKIFSWLSWSELGFFYFAGGFLALLMNAGSSLTLLGQAWFNAVTLPYIFFSIYYQWRIARQWCLLCVIVQIIFVTEFIISLSSKSFTYILVSGEALNTTVFLFLLAYLLPVLFWIFVKKNLIKAKAGASYRREYLRLKHDPLIFKSHVAAQRKIPVDHPFSITWGNLSSKNVITMVCSAYCKPCALAHPVVADILRSNDNVKIQLVFSLLNSDRDRNIKPIRHLLALYEKHNTKPIEGKLSEWWKHAQKNDYNGFSLKYPLNGELLTQDDKINSMTEWCNELQISYTPTFFVNGYELPGTYTVEDVRYILSSWNWDWENF